MRKKKQISVFWQLYTFCTMLVSYSDDETDDAAFCLPRNLSYAEESYLNSYSVSSAFVNSVNKERRSLYDTEVYLLNSAIMSENEVVKSCNESLPTKVKLVKTQSNNIGSDTEIPIQRTNGEKLGFYLNATDDLDSVGSSSGKSNCSELEVADTINSPDEYDLGKEDGGSGATFGEAVSNALKSMDLNDQYDEETKSESASFASKRLSSFSSPPLRIQIESVDDDSGSDKNDPLKGSQKSLLDSPLYEDTEFNFNRTELRKSSSLKSTKTPPGTPSRKKMVRFADAMGLDLESVRHVLNADAPPKIPASATADLKNGIEKDRQGIGSLYLCYKFQQPGAKENFLVTVMTQKVSLENAVITDLTITGTVRVANIGFHKVVRVRYTTNGWTSFHDIMASYVQNSCDGPTDRFSFSVVAPSDFGIGSRLEFAISYSVGDAVYWDNNNGENYCFECFAKSTPLETRDSWMHFI